MARMQIGEAREVTLACGCDRQENDRERVGRLPMRQYMVALRVSPDEVVLASCLAAPRVSCGRLVCC